MHVVIIAALMVALTMARAELMTGSPLMGLMMVSIYLLTTISFSGAATSLAMRKLQHEGADVGRAVRVHNLLTLMGRLWLVLGLGATVGLGYGRFVLVGLGLENVPLVSALVLLVPFFAALLLTWLLEYPFFFVMKRRAAEISGLEAKIWSLREFLMFNVRHHLLFVLAPVCTILLLSDTLLLLIQRSSVSQETAALAHAAGTIVIAGSVFIIAPAMVVSIWKTRRLPDGPLRDELELMCRHLGLKYREILVWDSGGMIGNAGVMGLIWPIRYILLTDALLENMTPREIRSIFAHEAGHIASHHIFYYIVFGLCSILLSALFGHWLIAVLGLPVTAGDIGSLVLLVVAWGLGFGWISRRFERQSDVIGAWASSRPIEEVSSTDEITHEGAAVFSSALQNVAQLNGIPYSQRNWRHGSIGARVRYILWVGMTGGSRRPIDRLVRKIKLGLWGLLMLTIALMVAHFGWGAQA
ncbi:MAG: M48 family metallopeptidase [Phycisphaerae bacterium]